MTEAIIIMIVGSLNHPNLKLRPAKMKARRNIIPLSNITVFCSSSSSFAFNLLLKRSGDLKSMIIPMFFAGIIMLFKSPDLLRRRLNAKEEEDEQKTVILVSGIIFLLAFILAGLNFRFEWFHLPSMVVIIASVIFLLAYIMYAEVLRENEYLSRTVEVSENQKVVDSGLYGLVRHPMYTSTIFLFLSMPLVLDSIFSFIVMLVYPINSFSNTFSSFLILNIMIIG